MSGLKRIRLEVIQGMVLEALGMSFTRLYCTRKPFISGYPRRKVLYDQLALTVGRPLNRAAWLWCVRIYYR